MTDKQRKYLNTHPLFEEYRGWKIRTYNWNANEIVYTVDVRVGVEGCMASHIEEAREFIDEKIKEGKIQQEDS